MCYNRLHANIFITFSRPQELFISTRCLEVPGIIANIITFLIAAVQIKILQMYTNRYKTCFTHQFYLHFILLKPIARSCRVSFCILIKVARGPWHILSAGPLRRGLAILATSKVQKNRWGQKDKFSRDERGYRMAVLTE